MTGWGRWGEVLAKTMNKWIEKENRYSDTIWASTTLSMTSTYTHNNHNNTDILCLQIHHCRSWDGMRDYFTREPCISNTMIESMRHMRHHPYRMQILIIDHQSWPESLIISFLSCWVSLPFIPKHTSVSSLDTDKSVCWWRQNLLESVCKWPLKCVNVSVDVFVLYTRDKELWDHRSCFGVFQLFCKFQCA